MCLLAEENLVPDQEIFWVTAFGIIKKIITRVDYKGVREIMKVRCHYYCTVSLGCFFIHIQSGDFHGLAFLFF